MKRWHLKPWANKVLKTIMAICIVVILGVNSVSGSEGWLLLFGLSVMALGCAAIINEYGE